MADKSYDAIIVGGGNKALALAMYLTKYGKMSVGIFEERHELGGGWSSEEPSPGFMGNTCSNNHQAHYHIPLYWDFPEWKDYGARYQYTKTVLATAFEEDDTCLAQFSACPDVDPTQEKTAAHMSKFSKKDADTYLKLWEKSMDTWYPAMMEWAWNPPTPFGQPDAMERLIMNPQAGIDPVWLFQSPLQLFSNLFEDRHVQVGYFRTLQSYGFQNDQSSMGLNTLMTVVTLLPSHCYVVGGTHALAHASYRVIYENGGEVFTNSKVDKIVIENGRARGVKLADGTAIEAKKLVTTTVDPYQLCFELIGKDYLSENIQTKVKNIERDWISIHWYSWAFTERPKWKCEAFEQDVWDCMWMCLGDLNLDAFSKESSQRKLLQWPEKMYMGWSYMGVSDVDKSDQCMAPPEIGFKLHTEQFTLPAWAMTDKEWKKNEKEWAENAIEKLQQYTTNVNWDIVAGYTPVTPYYTARMARNYAPAGNWAVIDNTPAQMGRFRPIAELAGYRVPELKGLYCTGTAWHPFALAWSTQGYNCYKVIAEDFGLTKTWEDRPF